MKNILRTLFAVTVPVLALTPAGCSYLDVRQRQLIFRPIKTEWTNFTHAGAPYEELWLAHAAHAAGGDARYVHAWWVPAEDPAAPAVLFLHGAAHSIAGNADRIAQWQRMGYSVLAIDYRGYGKSPGDLPTEQSVYADAQLAWRYLSQLQPNPSKRFVYGHSLGGAVAIELVARNFVRGDEAAGLIVESTFTSIRDMARIFGFSWLPVGRAITQNFDSVSKVAHLKVPTLFIHGMRDEVIPYAMTERLYAAAPEPKQMVLFRGGHHGDIPDLDFDSYRCAVREFTAGLCSARAG